jgi:LacI family transcriptional regulator
LRPISYVQASDPVIFEALDANFDGIFIIVPLNASQLLLDRLARHRERVVSLLQNFSYLGIPSFLPAPAPFITMLLDHLVSLGHRRIDCFSTMPHDSVVDDRIRHWRMGMEQRGLVGELHDYPTAAFECSTTAAYQQFGRMIDSGLKATAFVCVTAEWGRGVIRACHERGVRVGQDISVCGFSEDRVARLAVPSITTVAETDAEPFLKMGLEWITTGGADWRRPLLLQPDSLQLFLGESTGPCRS